MSEDNTQASSRLAEELNNIMSELIAAEAKTDEALK